MPRRTSYIALIIFAIYGAVDVRDANCQTRDVQPLEATPAIAVQGSSVPRFWALRFNDYAFSISYLTLLTATVADFKTTWHVTSRGGYEMNPFLGQSRLQESVVGAGTAVGLAFVTGKLHKTGHPKLSVMMNVAAAGGHAFAAWHNAQVLR